MVIKHNSRSQSWHTSPPPPSRGNLPTAPHLLLLSVSEREAQPHLGSVLQDNGGAMLGTSTSTKRRGCGSHCCSTGTGGSRGGMAAAWTTDCGWTAGGTGWGVWLTRTGDPMGQERRRDPCTARGEQRKRTRSSLESAQRQEENKGKRCPRCRGANSRRTVKRLQWLS